MNVKYRFKQVIFSLVSKSVVDSFILQDNDRGVGSILSKLFHLLNTTYLLGPREREAPSIVIIFTP